MTRGWVACRLPRKRQLLPNSVLWCATVLMQLLVLLGMMTVVMPTVTNL